MNYDVIVIGAGLGGLTAGARLARKGKKVLMIEQHEIPGGCATTFKRDDFTVEAGLHELDSLDEIDAKREIFEELDIFNNVEFLALPDFYRYINKNIDITIPHNATEVQRVLLEKFPEEAKGLKNYFKQMSGVRKEIRSLMKVIQYGKIMLPLYPLLFPYVVRNTKKTVGQFLDENFTNEDLKLLLTANLIYYHDDPYNLTMLYFSIGQDGYYNGGWYIKGGSQKLSDYLASCITDNGGTIHYKHLVEKVLVENNKAVGVEYRPIEDKNAEAIRAYGTEIIANNAVPNLIGMLPTKNANKLKSKTGNLEHSCSIITMYIGFSKTPKSLGNKHYSTIIANTDIEVLEDLADDWRYSDFSKRQLIFVDYSQVDSALAPAGKSFGVLATSDYADDWNGLNPDEYKTKKEVVCHTFLDRLEKHIPGILQYVEYYELGTAKSVERYTLNPGGAIYGFAQTVPQTGIDRFGLKKVVKNLHVASAWGFPGGGFTGAILSGDFISRKIK